MTTQSDQFFESYVPVYDAVPEKWEDGRQFLVEHLKKVSNAVNIRTIGWYLDEELLSGNAFIPGVTVPGNNPSIFRSILRKVVDVGPLAAGPNAGVPHGITFDINFTLIHLWVSGTDSVGFIAQTISGDNVVMDAVNLVITSPAAFNRAFAVIEYIQEL